MNDTCTLQDGQETELLLLIADISGFTRFMTSGWMSSAHRHTVIKELIIAIIKQVEIPINVQKVEGDAIFMYSPLTNKGDAEIIGNKLAAFFSAFEDMLNELRESDVCPCRFCNELARLRLKMIIHHGKAIQCEIAGFIELSGVDIIIAHKLLKNSVQIEHYLLLTDQAIKHIHPMEMQNPIHITERYMNIENIKCTVYPMDYANDFQPKGHCIIHKLITTLKIFLASLPEMLGIKSSRA